MSFLYNINDIILQYKVPNYSFALVLHYKIVNITQTCSGFFIMSYFQLQIKL